MMLSSRPMASLSPNLLARKGQARPAMRRQGFVDPSATEAAGDDLGWNDMGEGAALAPVLPPVLEQRRHLAEELAPAPLPAGDVEPAPTVFTPEPLAVVAPVSAGSAQPRINDARRAAFTLRLDADRHLRLRLASATRGRSAQKLVTEALDAFLATLPEVATLHAQLAGAQQPNDRGK